MIWFYDCTWLEEWISNNTLILYFIALFLFLASHLMTITNVFNVFIDGKRISIVSSVGKCVYSKEKGKVLPSVDVCQNKWRDTQDLFAVISYNIKTDHENYEEYLK